MGEQAEIDKLKDQLARAMKGFTVTKQQLQLKTTEAEQAKNQAQSAQLEAAQLREERDSGAPRHHCHDPRPSSTTSHRGEPSRWCRH